MAKFQNKNNKVFCLRTTQSINIFRVNLKLMLDNCSYNIKVFDKH